MEVRMRRTEQGWEVVHPRCAMERSADMEEVQAMLDGGELEIAEDELRWLISGCPDCLEAHALLGEIALDYGDFKLARGHYGRVFAVVQKACEKAGARGPLPIASECNRVVHESGKALVLCLGKLEKKASLRAAVKQLLEWDPTDPLGVCGLAETFGVRVEK